ncbi:hypothetical protein LZ578_03365 [Jeotgalibaca sp. MA1X17-3]|uniref:hypothetical protein n=1 Tax=Jeotgalibaca sp. MA1X17-3 TaxID=2908211 RepID=UPI001F486606|nr:hypothetical protein [Jeotgalibaca sp. MA1X17-3]UJF16184.1 hypothetical protein LZ578_03365 [Jeotgalibaca sp. MA1X17-3]
MEHEEWMKQQIKELERKSSDYRQKALYQEFLKLIEEQYKRIEQTEGEIDGRMWSPKEWG